MAEISDSNVSVFEANRQFLLGLAYRLLGRYTEAEDIVQDAFLRWHRAAQFKIQNPRAYLAKITTRLCLDYLKSAKAKREEYVGPWLPEPVLENALQAVRTDEGGVWELDGMRDLSYALMLTLERLSPLERAAFILHDIFDMPFKDIALLLERQSAACRQLASRARSQIKKSGKRFQPSREMQEQLVNAFVAAISNQNIESLGRLLAEDAKLYADGGGIVLAATRPLYGKDTITAFLKGVLSKNPVGNQTCLSLIELNDSFGFVMHENDLLTQINLFEVDRDGHIVNIYVLRNPYKLKHLHLNAKPV